MKKVVSLFLILSITFAVELLLDNQRAYGKILHIIDPIIVTGTWKLIEGGLKQVSVGIEGRVWGVNSADQIWTRPGVNGTWQLIEGALKWVSVGIDGRVWGVNSADQIYTRLGVNSTWQLIEGGTQANLRWD